MTGEQGYVDDDERSFFWTKDDIERVTQSRLFKGRWLKRKGEGRAIFGDEQAQDPEMVERRGPSLVLQKKE